MHQFARQASSTSLKIERAERPFSNFDFIDEHFSGCPTLARLMSQARSQGIKTIVTEKLKRSADLREEDEDLATATGTQVSSEAYRVTFFATSIKRLTKASRADIIGYAILKRDALGAKQSAWRVYESVLKKSSLVHNFIRGEQEWTCAAGPAKFTFPGYLYAEQNGITNVCAHAALRTATARFMPGGFSYRQMNKIVGINHRTKRASKGLNTDQIVRILKRAGARCFVGDFTPDANPPSPVPFQKYIYNGIESGFPAIIFFGTTSSHNDYHVVPVFGHTFNQDTWVPTAERSYFGADTTPIPSDSWLSMFIAHDDNWGSNLCIPRHYLQTKEHPASPSPKSTTPGPTSVQSVAYIIGTIPKAVEVSPLHAEAIGADYLFTMLPQLPNADSSAWSKRLFDFAQKNQLVLRPLLITGSEYADHLERIKDWDRDKIDKDMVGLIRGAFRKTPLWMIELSIPELFSANKRKLGEVLLRAEGKIGHKRTMSSFVLARLPGCFSLYRSGGPKNPEYNFVPSGAEGHVELFGCEESPA